MKCEALPENSECEMKNFNGYDMCAGFKCLQGTFRNHFSITTLSFFAKKIQVKTKLVALSTLNYFHQQFEIIKIF